MNQEPKTEVDVNMLLDAANEAPKDVTKEKLGELSELCRKQMYQEDLIAHTTKQLEDYTAELNRISKVQIPALMEEIGLAEIKLEDGSKVTVAKHYQASISEARRAAAIKWLEDNQCGALIKSEFNVPFDRGSKEEAQTLADFLSAKGFTFQQKETVHAATLKAFVKDRIESGQPLPTELFGVFIGKETKIKAPKEKKI